MLHPNQPHPSVLSNPLSSPPVAGLFSMDFVPALVVRTALRLELFRHIGLKGATFEQLSSRKGLICSARGLKLTLETLVAYRLVERHKERYRLLPLAATFLHPDSPAYMGPAVIAQIDQLSRWWSLEEAIVSGTTPFAPIEGDQDDGAFFGPLIQALFAVNAAAAKEVAEWLPPLGRVLDLGCGAAVWSLALALTQPQCQVVAVDRASVLDKVTRDCVESFGTDCRDRYTFQAGDFRQLEFSPQSFDGIFLGHILHNEGRQASEKLLKRMRRALRPGGSLIIAEVIGADPPSSQVPSLLFDLNMLLFTQKGQVFTSGELDEMLFRAGFSTWEWLSTSSPSPILVAQ